MEGSRREGGDARVRTREVRILPADNVTAKCRRLGKVLFEVEVARSRSKRVRVLKESREELRAEPLAKRVKKMEVQSFSSGWAFRVEIKRGDDELRYRDEELEREGEELVMVARPVKRRKPDKPRGFDFERNVETAERHS